MYHFYVDQWQAVPPLEPEDLSGQTVLVVGANIGLGFEAAKSFARMSPGRLVLACRSVKKGEDAAKRIREETGYGNIACYAVDLSVFSSVIAFAEEFEKGEGRLDILVYNAGVAWRKYQGTADGYETCIQVNDLSSILLCVLLLPVVIKTSEATVEKEYRPRMTFVTSETHFWVRPTPEELSSPNMLEKINDPAYCSLPSVMACRYWYSKLINVLFTRELAKRLPPSKAIVNCVNPGLCRSSLGRNIDNISLRLRLWMRFWSRTAEAGGREIVWAAIGGRHRERELHGKYISDMEVREEGDFAVSRQGYAMQEKIWNESIEALSRVSPRFKEIAETYFSN
ncbi:short-chain dehydrogenase [Vararia minispora EC-137]|uniref:Short-chain dehydrogenase n=1 Tax=Vararia minispora EC-137 TaxID=1314806 RepID=A0ACB8QUQ4_9AGAM|nr:short-chain dehydrogenase [Vararia minispora EC-137]